MLSNTCVESQDSLGLHSPASFTFCIVCPQSDKAQRLYRLSLTRFLRAHDITRKPDVEMVQHNSPTPFSTEKKPEDKAVAMGFRTLVPGIVRLCSHVPTAMVGAWSMSMYSDASRFDGLDGSCQSFFQGVRVTGTVVCWHLSVRMRSDGF